MSSASAITGGKDSKARIGKYYLFPLSAYIVTIFPVIMRSLLSVFSKESEGEEQFSCGGGARPDTGWWAGLLELHSDLTQVDVYVRGALWGVNWKLTIME